MLHMLYRSHFTGRPNDASFGITVDCETLTWVSEPPGHDLALPHRAYFSASGSVGSGKELEVRPGGRAIEVKR